MPEFPCPAPITVDIRAPGGIVEVYAEPRDTAVVEVDPYDNGDASREAAEQTRVDLTGDTLVVASPEITGWLWRRSPKLRIIARVPTGSTGRIRSVSADITCHGEWADAKLNSASGDAEVSQVHGDLTVNTASGRVQAAQVGGRLTVKTASGDVSARQVSGPVDVKTASGSLRLDDAGADVNVKSASGSTTLGATRRGRLSVNAVSGDISVGVVAGTGVWLEMNTLSGKTHSDLAISDGGGSVASHDLTIQARTVSGNIDIHRVTLPTAA